MASPLFVFQQILSELHKSLSSQVDDFVVPATAPCSNGSSVVPIGSALPTSATAILQDLPSLITLLFSFSALGEWFKLLVYGSSLEILRRTLLYSYRKIYDSFFITATFDEDDVSYSWVCYWLSQRPTWRKARDIEVSTDTFGLKSGSPVMIEGEEEDSSAIIRDRRQLSYLPSQDTIHSMWYKGHCIWVTRVTRQGAYGRRDNFLELRILTRSHGVLNNMLIEAKKTYQDAQKDLIQVYVSDSDSSWRLLASRPKRSLNSVILDPGKKDVLIQDAKDFLSSKAWYAARGIPFRRGYLLYGAPGSGKTSIIHSLAGELGLDVYIISLAKSAMDDATLNELISELPEKCIALMEDIDAAFSQTLNRESNSPDPSDGVDDDDDQKSSRTRTGNSPLRPTSRVTLSGLLNALDGVGAQEGRILFATTNKYDSLDPALCRPGRMDIHLEFQLASRYQARELFKCFYMPDSESKDGGGGLCGPEAEEKMSAGELQRLADDFTEAIPERELSMASLQGYLMGYKVRPVDAVREASMWVAKEREEKGSRDREDRRNDGKVM